MIRRAYEYLREEVLANLEEFNSIRIGYTDTRDIVKRTRDLVDHIHEIGNNGLPNVANLAGVFLVHLLETSDNDNYRAGSQTYFLLNHTDRRFMQNAYKIFSEIHEVMSVRD